MTILFYIGQRVRLRHTGLVGKVVWVDGKQYVTFADGEVKVTAHIDDIDKE